MAKGPKAPNHHQLTPNGRAVYMDVSCHVYAKNGAQSNSNSIEKHLPNAASSPLGVPCEMQNCSNEVALSVLNIHSPAHAARRENTSLGSA